MRISAVYRVYIGYILYILRISHEIFKGFDANSSLETCGIFLDLSKAVDRIWHEALIFKLQSYGILDSLLRLFNSFFLKGFKESF